MTSQLRAELLKLRSIRSPLVLLLCGLAVVALGTVAQGLSPKVAAELTRESKQRELFAAASAAILFATYVGLITVTGEFRYRTIRTTLLVQPRRRIIIQAKLAAAALTGLVVGVAGVGVSFLGGLLVLHARNIDLVLSGGHAALIAGGTIAASALCAMLGVAVGALVRNQMAAIMALGAWSVAVESILFATVPRLGRFLPGEASNALAGLTTPHLLAPAAGAALLVAWAMALAVAAVRRDDRSDIA